jgi:hypothetical protein
MSSVPTIAYIMIGVVVIGILALNVGLLLLLKDPSKFKLERRAPRSSRRPVDMGNFLKVLRDPFAQERGQLQELSSLVKELEPKKSPDENSEQ